jgi:hypothetical protein
VKVQELSNDRFKARPLPTWKGFLGYYPQLFTRCLNECEPGVGAAYIPCQNHVSLSSSGDD